MTSTTQPLAIYLHDHLAAATCALDLVRALGDSYRGQELGDFANWLCGQIASDKEVLHQLAAQVGPASDPLKDGAAWLAEKVSRIKLSHRDGLGLFETLEFLSLGIHGKAALWRALAEVADRNAVLAAFDFDSLRRRAEEQEGVVEQHRLAAARKAFGADAELQP
jgi:hypothetical protein